MNLDDYSLDMLLLAAIKAEEEASETYDLIADLFLSPDLEQFLNEKTEEELALPEEPPVPLPDIEPAVECDNVEEMVIHIMDVEKKSSRFYRSLAQRFEKGGRRYNALIYLSNMENEHFERFESLLDEDIKGTVEGLF